MSGRIHILDSALSNQIAAGEVVERPGSALKELVENSFDAGAKHITIRLAHGGCSLLEVVDDGYGIWNEDLPLALARHATSKILTSEDLAAIRTWGFRGEALASIAAVSRLTVSSRRDEEKLGREILCEATEIQQDRPLSRPRGTTVRIEDLFFNTPVRKKFLKSQASETSFCLQMVQRLALSRPEVQWEVWVDNQEVLFFPAVSSPRERVVQVFRDALKTQVKAEELIHFENIKPEMKVSGYILPTRNVIPSTRGIFLYVNGRSVKDKLLQQAVTTAAREVLFGGNFPQLVLFLETKPEEVDVNVHPTKAEVRFSQPQLVFGLIRSALERAIAADRPLPATLPESTEAPSSLFSAASSPSPGAPASGSANLWSMPASYSPATASTPGTAVTPLAGLHHPLVQYLATLRNTYIVCQDSQGLLLVDQHAAHERITYERLKARQQNSEGRWTSAPLLIPIVVEVAPASLPLLLPVLPQFTDLGLVLDQSGPSQITVREIPTLLLGRDNAPTVSLSDLVRNLADELQFASPDAVKDILLGAMLETLATQACHGSVRAGQTLTKPEAEALLQQMQDTDFSGHCPHGRPTTVRMSWSEIERLFKRIL